MKKLEPPLLLVWEFCGLKNVALPDDVVPPVVFCFAPKTPVSADCGACDVVDVFVVVCGRGCAVDAGRVRVVVARGVTAALADR